MKYDVISADGHVDLIWLPPDLFTKNASAQFKDRMPHVIDGPKGPEWVSAKGAKFGLVNGMGSAGREYVPGIIHRSDRMASTGLYDDGKKGIRRLTEVDLRLKDQERDGVQAEVLYGVLGSSGRLNDPEAALEMLRIYNDWLHDFCSRAPDRLIGLANIPNYNMEESVAEAMRCAKRGVRGLDIANRPDMVPLWDEHWEPLWKFGHETGIPLHFHTIGGRSPDVHEVPAACAAPDLRRAHHRLPDAHEHHADGPDLLRRAGALSQPQDRDRRGRARLDPLRAAAHGPRMGGPVPGPRPQDEAQRVLAPAVLRHLPDRPGRHRAAEASWARTT